MGLDSRAWRFKDKGLSPKMRDPFSCVLDPMPFT